MSQPPPRTLRPWVALLLGVGVVGALLTILSLLDESPELGGGGGQPITDRDVSSGATDLSPLEGTGRPDNPEPLEGEHQPPVAADLGYGSEPGLLLIVGRVEDGLGNPLADIEVNLFDDLGEYLDSELSELDGTFVLEWDEPLLAGWALGTEPDLGADPDDASSLGPAIYVHPVDTVPGDEPVECLLVVLPAPRIEGIVYAADSREPASWADIEMVSVHAGWIDEFQDTFTEEDGTFAMSLVDLPSTGLLIRVLDEEDRVAMVGPLDLSPGEVRWLEIPLHDPRTITGRLLDAHTGGALENGEVMVLPLHEAYDSGESWDLSFDDGGFTLEYVESPPEITWIYAEAEDHGPALVQVPRGRDEIDIRLSSIPLVVGRVTEGDDVPVEAAMVRFVLSGPGGRLLEDYEDVAFTDEDGRFELELEMVPADAAEVIVEGDDHVRFRRTLSELSAIRIGAATELQVELTRLPSY
jgi:hypothetical protein